MTNPIVTPIGRWHVVPTSGGLTATTNGRAIIVRSVGDGLVLSLGRVIAPAYVWREMLRVADDLITRMEGQR